MKRYFLYSLLVSISCLHAIAQPGAIIETGDQVLDPDSDGFVSETNTGFLGDGYDPDEFEIKMFGIPILGDGEALGDVNSGAACGVSDLALDSAGYAVYAAYDAGENLIFRFRTAGNKPSVQSYSVIIDSDDLVGPDDPNSNSENPGFEIEVTLIQNFGVYIYDIDGIDTCPDPIATYSVDTHQQKSTSSEQSCDDEDYFIDFYVPFSDLEALFGITPDTPLKFVGVTNISATCFLGGSVSDIGGIDDRDYEGCLECAILDLATNACPATVSNLCETCAGFPEGITERPAINTPVLVGDVTISGTSEEDANIFLDIFNSLDQLIDQDTVIADASGDWVSNTLAQPLTFEDSVVVNALIPGKCQSGLNNAGLSFAIVTPNQPPIIAGDLSTLGYSENQAPIKVDETITVTDDNTTLQAATVQITGNYEQGLDQLAFTAVPGISGSFDAQTGEINFTGPAPIADYETLLRSVTFVHNGETPAGNIRSISFIVFDLVNSSPAFTRNVLVSPVNDPPQVLDGGVPTGVLFHSTEEETAISICLTTSDIEQDLVDISSFSIAGSSSTIERVPGELCLIYTPYTEFSGTENLTVTICDNGSPQACTTISVVLDVTPVNDAPVVLEDGVVTDTVSFKIEWNTTLNECLTTFDIESDVVRVTDMSLSQGTGSLGFMLGTTCFNYTPLANTLEEAWASAMISDDGSPEASSSVVIQIEVVESNLSPVVEPDTIITSVLQNQTVTTCIIASDPNGDLITLVLDNQTTPGSIVTFDQATLCADYTPPVNFFGKDYITITACDDFSPPLCDAVVLEIDVIPFNNPPVILVDDIAVDTVYLEAKINTVLDFCLEAVDPDLDQVLFQSVVSNTGNGQTVHNQDFCFEFTPALDFVGTESATVVFCDDHNPVGCGQVVLMIEVFPENRPPEIQLGGVPIDTLFLETELNTNLDFCLEVFDFEGDLLGLSSIEEIQTGGFILPGSSSTCFTYIPNEDFFGTDIKKITICDDGTPQGCDDVVVVTSVGAVNNAPIILWNGVSSDTIQFEIDKNQTLDICLELNDPDNDAVLITRFERVIGEGDLSFPDPETNCSTYTPPEGYVGDTWILVEACDTGVPQKCANAIIGINVLDFNLPPLARNDTISTKEDMMVTGNFLLNDSDPDGDSLTMNTVSLVLPVNGTLQITANGDFTYMPEPDFHGVDSVRYSVCDVRPDQLCGEAMALFEIEPQPDPIIAYEAVSPNGDGYNDFWRIQNIEEYPNNLVSVFDRWNNMVFFTGGYNNLDVIWTGESNRGAFKSNVGSGTYFYVIDLNDGTPVISGMIVLKR